MKDVSRLSAHIYTTKSKNIVFNINTKYNMGKISYASVQRRSGEEISSMLKRFKRKVEDSGHLIELRNRKEYLKPSVVKRKAKQEAVRKEWLKNLKENSK